MLQFIRYLFVGGLAFVVDFGLLYVCTTFLHIHYLISAAVGFTAGLIINYLLSKIWVFSKSKYNDTKAFLLFALVGVIGLGFNELLMYLFTDLMHYWFMLSKIIATILVFIWNFAARKILVF